MSTFLHIVKTNAYKHDSRIIKWVKSLEDSGHSSIVFVLEDSNFSGICTDGKNTIVSTSLFSRKVFRKRKGYLLKIPEFTIKTISFVRRTNADFIVFHDLQSYLTMFVLRKTNAKIIWDLHELPHSVFFKYNIAKKILQYLMEKVDFLVYTNEERRAYIKQNLKFTETHYSVLNNYSTKSYNDTPVKRLPSKLAAWLKGKPYFLWLGVAGKKRNFISALKAFEPIKDNFKLVILGGIEEEIEQYIQQKQLSGYIYNTYVNQDEIITYIDNCFSSIVLYKNNSPNNLYCEPNRLYQLIARNIPVICGYNPPMKNIVTKYKAGIVLPDDGSDIERLKNSISEMIVKREEIRNHLRGLDMSSILSWDKQFANLIHKLENR